MDFIIKNKYWLLVGSLCLIIVVLLVILFINNEREESISFVEHEVVDSVENISESNKVFVDIKGAVKKPGVYELDKESKVVDVITLAGGLSKNADTKNINLSQHVKDEMVIYIFTKNELKTTQAKSSVPFTTTVINYDSCIEPVKENNNDVTTTTTENKNQLVNINTASKEELMTLSGIGSSKADLIIIKRNESPFNSIEDIMSVSGIGESAFAKIKDYITV